LKGRGKDGIPLSIQGSGATRERKKEGRPYAGGKKEYYVTQNRHRGIETREEKAQKKDVLPSITKKGQGVLYRLMGKKSKITRKVRGAAQREKLFILR